MDINTFHFYGDNRHIIILPRNVVSPTGFNLATISSLQVAKRFVREITPHLFQDINAVAYICDLLAMVGEHMGFNVRAIAPKLSEHIASDMLSVHTEEINCTQGEYNTYRPSVLTPASAIRLADSVILSNAGQSSNNNLVQPSIDEQIFRADPIAMRNGEEVLSLVDFSVNGLMPLSWRRIYRSSQCQVNIGLGYGWRHNFSVQLEEVYQEPPKVGPKKPGKHWLKLTDEEGRVHWFPRVNKGQTSYQLSSGLALFHQTDGRQVLIKPDDSHWSFIHLDDIWLLETISNYHGQYQALYYDTAHRLVRIACSSKRGILLSYNRDNNIDHIRSYLINDDEKLQRLPGKLACYQYNQALALIKVINELNIAEQYQYAEHYLINCRRRASGFSHYFKWQGEAEQAKCIEQWGDDDIYHYQFSYQDGKSTCIDSHGNSEVFYHNEQGLLTGYVNANGAESRTEYDNQGRKISQVDASGAQTEYRYNLDGQLSAIIAPDGGKVQYGYNALGQHIITQNAIGQIHRRKFDATGRLLSEMSPDGRRAYYQYTDAGLLLKKTHYDGVVTLYYWNDDGDLLAKKTGDKLSRYSYDNRGNMNAYFDAHNLLTQWSRNDAGQVIEKISFAENKHAECHQQLFSYDLAGRLLSFNTSSGVQFQYAYDGLAQIKKKILPDGSWLAYQYDQERNLIAVKRSDGEKYQFEYSPTEKIVKSIGFDGREQQYGYDVNDRLISIIDSAERCIRFKRDNMGRISEQISLAFADNVAMAKQDGIMTAGQSKIETRNFYLYDKIGRLIRAHNCERTVTCHYHANGKVQQVNQGHWLLTYGYNYRGQREQLKLPDGSTIGYQYDQQGQMIQLDYCFPESKQVHCLFKRNYTKSGYVQRQVQGNGIVLEQSFDAFSRLSSQKWQKKNTKNSKTMTFCESRFYRYNKTHQLINHQQQFIQDKKTIKHEQVFSYNCLSQLINVDMTCFEKASEQCSEQSFDDSEPQYKLTYHWDSFGNPLTKSSIELISETDAVKQDRLVSLLHTDYQYDDSGNQISSLAQGAKQRRNFDGLNQLKQLNFNECLTYYEYDALGRRSAKITEQGRIDFLWDGEQLIGEHQNGRYIWYIFLPDSFEPIALIKRGSLYYYHLDQLGTPICLTDQSGEQVWRNFHDAFGHSSMKDESGLAPTNMIDNPIRFQGQYYDEESGLHYNRFRYYCPKQRRFIHQDPLGLVGGINPYQYTVNPVNEIDPFGLQCKENKLASKDFSIHQALTPELDDISQDKILATVVLAGLNGQDLQRYISTPDLDK